MTPLVAPAPPLTPAQAARYARHLSLPGFGSEAQRRLRAAKVLVVGAGGLGAPVLQYLTAAGVGQITVIDDDVVETSNLQRQVLHRQEDLGRPKALSACDALLRLDPEVRVRPIVGRLGPANALELFATHDLVIDGSDNFATRYLSNDAAEITGTPLVWGTIFRFDGQVSVFWPGQGPMLRDLFPDIPPADSVPNCAEGGVLGALCGTIGSTMATEAVKVICGIGEPLVGRLMIHDALTCDYRFLRLSADPSREPVTRLADDYAGTCEVPGPAAPAQAPGLVPEQAPGPARTPNVITGPGSVVEITADRLAEELAGDRRPVLLDVREEWERDIATLPEDRWVTLGRIRSGGWAAVTETLREADDVVVYCRSGVRSAEAVRLLSAGAPEGVRLRSLAGGVLGWPGTPQY
jgi:adenylyltransferase/sulfurtransferase